MDSYGLPGANPQAIAPFVLVAPAVLVVVWAAMTYNRLVGLRNLIGNAWSNVDTELRRRHDLIPNLVETVRAYAAHESAVIEAVTQARVNAMHQAPTPEAQAGLENELARTLQGLFAVCEGYPVLKSNENFLALQRELVNTEDRIQAARRFYNGNVREHNCVVDYFPSSLIARMCGFGHRQYFEVQDAVARQVASIRDELGRAAGAGDG